MKKKKKRKKYERVKGLNYFIYARLNGFAEIAEWSVEKAARKDGASWIEENPAWLQHGGRKGGGWRRFNEGSLSRLYAPPIQFFFLSPPPRHPPSVMRAIAPLARLSSAPTPCHLDPIHGGGNYLCKEAGEGRRSNEPSTIGTRLGPGSDISALFRPTRFQLSLRKKGGGEEGDVYEARSVDKLSR